MKINIYQINSSRDEQRLKFEDYESLVRRQGSSEINSSLYDRVFSGEVSCKDLEDVYTMFNVRHPADYRGHSLSISDVVEVVDNSGCPELVGRIRFYNSSFSYEECLFTDEERFQKEIRDAYDVGRCIDIDDLRGQHVPCVDVGFHYCDDIGFNKINFDPGKTQDVPGLKVEPDSKRSLDNIINECEGLKSASGTDNKQIDREIEV